MITQSELIKRVSRKCSVSQKDTKEVIDTMVDTMLDVLGSGMELRLYKFGRFDITSQAGKVGYDMQRGRILKLPETLRVRFRPADHLTQKLSGGSDTCNDFAYHTYNNDDQDEDTVTQSQ